MPEPTSIVDDMAEVELHCTDPDCAHIYYVPEVEYDPGNEFQHTCPSCLHVTGELESE